MADETMTPAAEHAEHKPAETEEYYVHGGLHHNGTFHKHGSKVHKSMFGSNHLVDDEFAALRDAGTLKTAAEFFPPSEAQDIMNEKDAEIARLRKEIEELQAKHAEQFPKSSDL